MQRLQRVQIRQRDRQFVYHQPEADRAKKIRMRQSAGADCRRKESQVKGISSYGERTKIRNLSKSTK